jgi:hypothetical protein
MRMPPRIYRVLFATSLAVAFAIPAYVATAQRKGMALVPNHHRCVEVLQLEKVEIDAQSGEVKVEYDDAGVQRVSDYIAATSWVQGFFTAWNFYKPNADGNLTKETHPHQWMTWIFSYCRAHPSGSLVDASMGLADALSKGKIR